ncbi:chromosomal replication initiator protein DnaA [candidate division WOR-3 bacterium]|nr:chromosomal replication initiator protein DnaA [candidate division WOR-3 bacterium]MCK4526998.1 chromosomal replication initiator protein DnaA [candidate division WOR-3 bacterium]
MMKGKKDLIDNFNWKKIKGYLQEDINESAFNAWFANVDVEAVEENDVYFTVPNTFTENWISEHFLDNLKSSIKKATTQNYKIHFLVKQKKEIQTPSLLDIRESSIERKTLLHDRYTFSSFVVGDNNKFAYAAATAVANAPGREYNPLFIYGGVGLGKTHLLQAIGNKVYKEYANLHILYTQAEEFLNEMIKSIQEHSTVEFKKRYREIDLLLIDDIHFLARKERLQEEFFHTFNALFEAKKQIVISSDRPPQEIPDLQERLISRFHWGLTVDLQPPGFETRLAILRAKTQVDEIHIDDKILEYIASNIHSNIRELEGCLIKLLAHASIYKTDIDIETAKRVLSDIVPDKNKKPTPARILKEVSQFYNIPVADIKGNERSKSIVRARQVAVYLIRQITSLSLKEIGRYLGGKDHSTILYTYRKIDNLIKKNVEIKGDILKIKDILKGS